MLEPQHPNALPFAIFNTVISMASGFIAFISIGDVQAVGGLLATIIGCLSGIMAIRYYVFATREKKQNIVPIKRKIKR